MARTLSLFTILCSLWVLPWVAKAEGFGINATRLIYPQGVDSISVSLRNNTSDQPFLVQARVSRLQTSFESAPFVVRPPLFRMEPGSVNQVRISALNLSLPTDRESVFFFQATATPSSSAPVTDNQENQAQGVARFGLGSTIKLFYRPNNLPSSSADAQRNLQFSRVAGGVQANNVSPYFVNLASLRIGEQTIQLNTQEKIMLAPFSRQIYQTSATRGEVRWQAINDQGGIDAFSQRLP